MHELKRNEVERQLRYTYSTDERIAKAVALAGKLDHLAQLDDELSRIKKDYGNRIDTAQAEADRLSTQVKDGFELRPYICFWTFDDPRPGRKLLRRKDTGEIVAEEEMTMADQQTVMDEIDPATKAPEPPEPVPFASASYPNPYPPIVDVNEATVGGGGERYREWLNELFFCADGEAFTPEDFDVCQREQIAAMVTMEPIADLIDFLQWLESGPYDHCQQAASVLRSHADFRAAVGAHAKQTRAEVKAAKKARKPRAVSSGGVVGTAEDGDVNTPDEDRRGS